MSAAKAGNGRHRCSACGYYLPINLEQSRTVEGNMDLTKWPAKAVHEVVLAVRRALVRCGVCGWRCEVVAGTDERGCEFWWRDE